MRNQSLFSSFVNAIHGIFYVFATQRNAKIHSIATILVLIISFLLHLTAMEWVAILLAIGFVWGSECLNTATEKITDLVSPEYNGLAKVTKDTAAAGVLIASIIAAIVGVIIFLPKLLALFH